MPIGAGGDVIVLPGSRYNGVPSRNAFLDLSRRIQGGDQQAVGDLRQLSQLPQFRGFGWQGLLAFALMAAPGGIAALTGPAAGAAAGVGAGAAGAGATNLGPNDFVGPLAGGPEAVGTAGLPLGLTTGGDYGAAAGIPFGVPASGGGNIGSIVDQIFSRRNLPDLLSGGSAILNSILQGRAANNAANLQTAAANHAADLEAEAAKNSLDFAKQVYGNFQTQNAPFVQAGTNALGEIQNLIAPGGELSQPFTAPTAAEVQATPGYQLRLDEAMKALNRRTHGLQSGPDRQAAAKFATDYAEQGYGTAFDRAMNVFQTNRANRLNPLFQIAGFGPGAVAQGNQAGQNAVGVNTGINTGLAQDIGQLGQFGAAYQAGAGVQSTNALTAALSVIANLAQQRRAQSGYQV